MSELDEYFELMAQGFRALLDMGRDRDHIIENIIRGGTHPIGIETSEEEMIELLEKVIRKDKVFRRRLH